MQEITNFTFQNRVLQIQPHKCIKYPKMFSTKMAKSAKLCLKIHVFYELSFVLSGIFDDHVQETRRFGLYLGDYQIIKESWLTSVA